MHSSFCCYFRFHILLQKLFYFFCMQLLIFPWTLSPNVLGESVFSYFRRTCFVYIAWTFPSISKDTWKSSSYMVSSLSIFFFLVFLFTCILMWSAFLKRFTCCHILFICPSSLISSLILIFLFRFLRGISTNSIRYVSRHFWYGHLKLP